MKVNNRISTRDGTTQQSATSEARSKRAELTVRGVMVFLGRRPHHQPTIQCCRTSLLSFQNAQDEPLTRNWSYTTCTSSIFFRSAAPQAHRTRPPAALLVTRARLTVPHITTLKRRLRWSPRSLPCAHRIARGCVWRVQDSRRRGAVQAGKSHAGQRHTCALLELGAASM